MPKDSEPKGTFKFFYRTSDIWDAMYADCKLARISIEFEQYIMMDDYAGHRFLQLFAEKARQGVKIRLMFDGVGSRGLLVSKLLDDIRLAGGEVYFYNSLLSHRAFMPSRWLPRSHVKTLLIDGEVAHTGSACMWEIMERWHEMHCRFTGPAVADVAAHFSSVWESRDKNETIRDGLKPDMNACTSYAVSHPTLRMNPIYRELLQQIKSAKKSIRLVTPYFLPPRRLRHELIRASRRGINVEILVSAKTDVPLADHVSHSYFPGLLRRKIRIFLYPYQVLHAKYALIDDSWATIGSTNMDYLSLFHNREANLIIRAPQNVLHELRVASDAYMRDSTQVDMQYCRNIPFMERLAGYMGRWIKGIL